MPFRSSSNSSRQRRGLRRLILIAAALVLAWPSAASAISFADDPEADAVPEVAIGDGAVVPAGGYELYLDISINGLPRHRVVAIYQEVDGSLSAKPEDLAEIGLVLPQGASQLADTRIALDSLPGVTYSFDPLQQSIDFTAPEEARSRQIVDAREDDATEDEASATLDSRNSGFGLVLNYDLYGSASLSDGGVFSATSPTGSFEARAYAPFGLIEHSFSLLGQKLELQRLNTTWSLSDPAKMRTYRAGDIATGALTWTRPTRLGGVQIQNDFGLRSDIITYPVPSITGSAAMPSSVEVYIDNSNQYSGDVLEGPFEIVDVPVLTGAGTIELVVKDAAGNKVTTRADYFASPRLLRPGLFDYSAELGFARTSFGSAGDGYDRRLMGSGSIRAGVTDWLTWEGHAEGGRDLLNVGSGLVATLGQLGVGQFSVAGSKTAQASGMQLTGSLQLSFGSVTLGARAQRSFGRYEDIASFTAPGITDHASAAPASLYQLSLSLPMPFEGSRANLSYTQSERANGDVVQLVAAGYGQSLFTGSASATAYADLKSGRYGAMMSLSMPFGGDISTRTSVQQDKQGATIRADIGHSGGNEVGDVGWLLSVEQGKRTSVAASARTKLPFASTRATLTHRDASTSLSAQISGAIIAADGGLYLSRKVNDAFAIVDVGAPGIPVFYQNRPVGVTDKNGKLLVPGLTAYEKNRISIDPTKLPLDKVVENTTAIAIPARGSGVLVTFGKGESGGTALVSFRDAKGDYLPLASTGMAGADASQFTVGYDGQAFLEGLAADNIVTISLPDGSSCIANVPYADQGSDLVSIPDIVCQPA